MKCVISRVLCQNACFSKSSHSLTHMYTAHTRRGRFGGCTKSEAALWASNPMHLGCKSQFHSLVLPSGPSGGIALSSPMREEARRTRRGPDALWSQLRLVDGRPRAQGGRAV